MAEITSVAAPARYIFRPYVAVLELDRVTRDSVQLHAPDLEEIRFVDFFGRQAFAYEDRVLIIRQIGEAVARIFIGSVSAF